MATTKIRGNTQIEAGTITNAEISASAAIASNKLADTPTSAATPNKIILRDANGRAQVADPSAAADIATKNYVDTVFANAVAGLDVKASVRAATTANITLSGTQTIDGVALVAGDRVLVKNQTTASQNGIYVVSSGAWSRSSDADTSDEVTAGMFVWVEEGTTNADTGWILTTDNPITLGTTNLTFTQFSGAGQIVAGAGLTKTGNQIDVGAGAGIQVNADSVEVVFGAVGDIASSAVGDSASAGTLNKAARADHRHAREGFGTPVNQAIGDTASQGTATTVARSDHRHGMPSFATPSVTLGTTAAAGSAITLLRSDCTIAAFDTTAPVTQAIGDTASTGTANVAARRDHRHGMPVFGSPVQSLPSHSASDGTATSVARSDHRHAREVLHRQRETGNGSTTSFPLESGLAPVADNYLMVFLNGILQKPADDYTTSGPPNYTVTFNSAPANGDKIEFAFWSNA